MTDDDRPPIDTARIRACQDGEYTDLVHDLCAALDAERANLAFWVDEANKRGTVVLGLMDQEKRADAAELTIKNLRFEIDALQRECAAKSISSTIGDKIA